MKTDFMVITFDENGGASAMHRDQMDLGFLGKQQIKRASEILFNEVTQLWDIYLPTALIHDSEGWVTDKNAQGFESYEQARSAEVAWLEMCAIDGVPPLSTVGVGNLCIVRLAILGKAHTMYDKGQSDQKFVA